MIWVTFSIPAAFHMKIINAEQTREKLRGRAKSAPLDVFEESLIQIHDCGASLKA